MENTKHNILLTRSLWPFFFFTKNWSRKHRVTQDYKESDVYASLFFWNIFKNTHTTVLTIQRSVLYASHLLSHLIFTTLRVDTKSVLEASKPRTREVKDLPLLSPWVTTWVSDGRGNVTQGILTGKYKLWTTTLH